MIVGAALGGAGLWLSLREVPAEALRASLLSAEPAWALAALVVSLLAVGAVVLRWRLLLQPSSVAAAVLARATLIGQMVNILVPFRLGEVARVYTTAQHAEISVARLTASLAIEKALDLAIFGVTAATLVTSALLPRSSLQDARWLVAPAVTVAALAFMWLMVRWRVGPAVAGWMSSRGGRAGRWVGHVVADVSSGLEAWRSAGHAGAVLAWTIVVFALAAAGNQLLLRAFRIELPLSAGFALLVVLQAGSVPPSLPGRIGIYNYLTVLTLGLYGVSRPQAATYSIALYVIAYVPKLVLGALLAVDPTWRPAINWSPRG